MINELKDLSSPDKFHNPISIKNHDLNSLYKMLESMILIRKAEQQLALARKAGNIGGPVHLGAGQEAIAVGVSQSLQKTDDGSFWHSR